VSLPVILRHEAEADIQVARDQLEAVRVGLGNQLLARVREVLARIETMPELHGKIWEDVRAARLKQFVMSSTSSCSQIVSRCWLSFTVHGTLRRGNLGDKTKGRRTRRWSSLAIASCGMVRRLPASCSTLSFCP